MSKMLGLAWTSQFQNDILAYSSYSSLVYDVTTGHMTLRFEIFWRETANWQEVNRQILSGNIHNCAESSDITKCMWIQVCKGHSGVYRGHYRDFKGRLFLVIRHIWCS